jgi:formylmethanofuran dehydrogenase subunit B
VVHFFDGYFGDESTQNKRQVFRLTGLDSRSPFANKRYEDLDESSQRKLKQSVLRAINIRQLSPKNENTSIYHIFERLNTGGTPLKPQEIRNCVFRGDFVAKMKNLNANPDWRTILGKPKLDTHQKDVELILRIFSLANKKWNVYEKPMKEFLNNAMNHDKEGKSTRVKKFVQAFPQATGIIVSQLGERPFHVRGPLNASALDAVMVTVIDNIAKIPKDFAKRFQKLLTNKIFIDATFYGTSDVTTLHARFKVAQQILIN